VTDRPSPRPFFDREGRLLIERRGLPRALAATLAKDAYHFLRRASWTRVFVLMAAVYLGTNLVFATVLWLGGATIVNARGFADYFWFSVQTLATIGYGYLAPNDTFAHVVVTIEAFVGLLLTAMATGIVFARFATPQARVLFSNVAVIAEHEGVPTLMFRMANARATAIVEATVKVSLTRDELLRNGERVRRIYDLVLRRNTSPMFALTWTAYHPIDAHSPLHGVTAEALVDGAANVLVTFTGIDDRLSASVHTRHMYTAGDLRWDVRFSDIIIDDATVEGGRYLDFSRFHDVEPPGSGGPTS
jgi:inward rectifier potassium channel